MKILILDDDLTFAESLKNDMEIFFWEITDDNQYKIYSSYNQLLKNQREVYDVCFIDIDLAGKNGIDIAREIKETGIGKIVVFVTAHHHLVYNSLIVQPYFFIRKGEYKHDLKILFELLYESLKKNELLALRGKNGNCVVPKEDIIFIETNEHAVCVHTTNASFFDSRSLKDFLMYIDYKDFVQIHKSYVINLKYIISFTSTSVTLFGNKTLNIGRVYKDNFYENYKLYLLR